MTQTYCHPGRARSAKIRDQGVNSAPAAVPDLRPASSDLSGMTAFVQPVPYATAQHDEAWIGPPLADLGQDRGRLVGGQQADLRRADADDVEAMPLQIKPPMGENARIVV